VAAEVWQRQPAPLPPAERRPGDVSAFIATNIKIFHIPPPRRAGEISCLILLFFLMKTCLGAHVPLTAPTNLPADLP